MKRLFDFVCSDCDEVTEKLVDTNVRQIECFCGGKAKRQISMPRINLEGVTGDFPTASDHWANIREQNRRVKGRKSWAEP